MPRKPSWKSTASSLPKGELFAAGEVESVVPELCATPESLRGHRRSGEEQLSRIENLFGDPRHAETDQLLKAYAHSDAGVK